MQLEGSESQLKHEMPLPYHDLQVALAQLSRLPNDMGNWHRFGTADCVCSTVCSVSAALIKNVTIVIAVRIQFEASEPCMDFTFHTRGVGFTDCEVLPLDPPENRRFRRDWTLATDALKQRSRAGCRYQVDPVKACSMAPK